MKFSKASLFLAAGLCMAPCVHAQESTPDPDPTGRAAGITVGIDPATGRLRNLTPAEAAELERQRSLGRSAAKTRRQSAAPADNAAAARTVRKSADGTVSARLPRSAMSELRGRIGPDGKLVLSENGHDHDAPASAPEAME